MSQLTTPPSPFADFPPVQADAPLTQAQILARNAGEAKPGFGTATWESTTHWATSWANRALRRAGQGMVTEYDPNFVATDELVKQYGEGLDSRYQAKLYGARSLDDMMELRDQFVDIQKSDSIIARTAHPTAAGLLAGVGDPIYLAAGVATGGASTALGTAMGGTRLARLAANGIINVASAAPVQAFVSSQDPQSNITSDIVDGAIGMMAIELGRTGFGAGIRLATNIGPFRRVSAEVSTPTPSPAEPHLSKPEVVAATAPVETPSKPYVPSRTFVPKESFDAAIKRLEGIEPDRKLNRTEVDAILEGTGYKTENQGWPTAEDMRGYIENMAAKERALEQADREIAMLNGARTDIEFSTVLHSTNIWEKLQKSGGGGMGAFEQDPTFQAIAGLARLNDAAKQLLEKHILTPAGKDHFLEQLDPDAPAKFMDQYIADAAFDPLKDKAGIDALKEMAPDIYALRFSKGDAAPPEMGKLDYGPVIDVGTPGEAPGFLPPESTEPPRPPARKEDFFPKIVDWIPGMRNYRMSRIGVIGRSKSTIANEIGNALFGDPLAKVDRATGELKPAYTAVDEWRRTASTRERVAFDTVYNNALDQWMKEQRVPAGQRLEAADTFRKMLHDVHLGVLHSDDPIINNVVEATRAQTNRLRELMQRHGAMSMEVPHDPKYLRRSYSIPRLNGALERYGHLNQNGEPWKPGDGPKFSQMEQFFGRALRETDGRKMFDEGKVRTIGATLLRQVLRTDIPLTQRAFSLSEGLVNELEDKLRSMGLSDAQVKDALFTASGEGAGGVSGAKPNPTKGRIDFNHDFQMELVNTQTGGTETVRLVDMLDHDYEAVVHDMIEQSVTMSAEKRLLESFGKAHERTYKRPQELFDEVAKELHAANVSDTEIASTVGYLERGWQGAMGRATNPNTGWAQFWRAARSVNNIIGSAAFGLAQVPQLGNVVATSGLRTMMTGMPEFASLLKQFKSAKVTDSTIRLIDSITAADSDSLQQSWMQRVDDRNIGPLSKVNATLDKVNSYIRTASGIEPINRSLRRMAAAGAINRWIEAAQSGKVPNKARLGQLGVSEADATAFLAAIKNDLGGSFEGPIFDKVGRINLDKWEPELAARFTGSIDRWAMLSADRSTLGSSANWMDTTMGKIMTQWRSFTIQAWEKQTLARLQANDFEAWAGTTYATMLGALTYAAQTYLRAVTMPEEERRKFLDERLSTERIATAAFNRNGFSSVLPMGMDTFQGATGGKQMFTYGRYSGLPNDITFWESNPTANLVGQMFNGAFPRALGPLRDAASGVVGGDRTMIGRAIGSKQGAESYDQRAAKAWFQIAPMRTMIGVQNFYDYLERQMPVPEN